MTHFVTKHRKLLAYVLMSILTLVMARTPPGQTIVTIALLDFVEVTERIIQFPCWMKDHARCLSLDRLDPTCPQCF